MEARDVRQMTYAAYLAAERTSSIKHEYINGRVYAMAGGSPEHARLAQAMGGELRQALRGKPCATFSSDLRVRIVATGRSTYPDVTVVCGGIERTDDDDDAVINPTVIVEVLSESTETDDRSDKWAHYQRIPTLREYVLITQQRARIEVFSRESANPAVWRYEDHGAGAAMVLPSLDITIRIDDVYADPLAGP